MKKILGIIDQVIMYQQIKYKKYLLIIPITFILILSLININPIYSTIDEEEVGISVYDPKLKIELIEENLNSPNNIAFLTNNDILIYEDSGIVKRITDDETIENPLLEFQKLTNDKIIMKAIVAKQKNDLKDKVTHDVFFYYVQCNINKECTHNVSSFELDDKNQKLINQRLLMSIQSFSEPSKINGILRLGTDKNIYLNLETYEGKSNTKYLSENKNNWLECVVQSNKDTNDDQNYYYQNKLIQPDNGHGLTYTFGTDYDPYSGKLWYLEKDNSQEQINILSTSLDKNLRNIETYDVINADNFFCIEKTYIENTPLKENKESSYKSLIFLDSKALGKSHMHNLFVISDANEILEFDLPGNRNGLSLTSTRDDIGGVLNNNTSLFANGFNMLTDLQINPYDGTLYVVDEGFGEEFSGSIYKIDRKVDSDSWFSP